MGVGPWPGLSQGFVFVSDPSPLGDLGANEPSHVANVVVFELSVSVYNEQFVPCHSILSGRSWCELGVSKEVSDLFIAVIRLPLFPLVGSSRRLIAPQARALVAVKQ